MPSSFADKRVLVTGANGFIGSWLAEALLEEGADVSALINKDGPLGLGGVAHIAKKLRLFYGDITRPNTIDASLKDQEIVFHLAALTQVIHSFSMAREFFDVNAMGTLNILENLRNSESLEFLVFSSTDKVYGEPQHLPIEESHPLSAKSPYDASKLAADVMVSSYNQTYGFPAASVRWSNTIGGRDSNILRALPDFATSIMHRKPPTIRGDGKQIRDYMYVTDATSGIISVAKNKSKTNGDVFNLGTERPTSVLDIANIVVEKMGMKGKMKPVVLGKNNPGEINVQYLSSRKAREKLGWKPEVSLEDGIEKTIEWYKNHPDWYDLMVHVKKYWDAKSS